VKAIRTALLTGAFADLKGRGARSNRESRFSEAVHEIDPEYLEHAHQAAGRDENRTVRELAQSTGIALQAALGPAQSRARPSDEDTAWQTSELVPTIKTCVTQEQARTIISRNQSPDVPFDRSINPYRGCEHGCVYCYARPSHAYLGLSPGLDFETRLFAKSNAAELLDRELRKPGYQPAMLALGANTDPYQPIEQDLRITRSVLQTLAAFGHPVAITTKSALVLRDLDLLQQMARRNLVRVLISIGSLDRKIARTMEPRASAPARRLEAIRLLAQAGVPAGVIVAPIIPALTDQDMEAVLEAAAKAGACQASYVVLRLPLEVRDLFVEWLRESAPLRAEHVMSLVRQMRGGRDYQPGFGTRMKGTGAYATLLRQRFELACRRLRIGQQHHALDCSRFRVPEPPDAQQRLF